ncbi:MAG: hypothetical protein DMG65_25480 [Candidatus Angelobacter sp. Gp1-AA117]|nr:MAG: hypothetical protein DMG65_25480 [Candidatus Angelobacter sp. Gp1-AA117]
MKIWRWFQFTKLQITRLPISMKVLLEVMRLFHHMVGITTPDPKDERKILFLWVGVILGIIIVGVLFVILIVEFVFH